MPQTVESIRFCQNAETPIIVAINKMDKEGANPDKVKTALMELGLVPEEWGGTIQFVPVSALAGDGIDNLLEALVVQTELMELSAEVEGRAKGVVIESKVEQGRGTMATVLIQQGTLKKGDAVIVGETYGRARGLVNYLGKSLQSTGPSTPVQLLGLNAAPMPGDALHVVKNEKEAKKIVQNRMEERRKLQAKPEVKVSLEDFFTNAAVNQEEATPLNIILRSDNQGSYEAIKNSLNALSTQEVEVKIIGGGVGAVNDNDVQLAGNAGGLIIGFNMRPLTSARKLAEAKGIDVRTYSIIYELIDDVKASIEGLFAPEFTEEFVGRADVREIFVIPKIGAIAGSSVVDGKITTGSNIRLLRAGQIVHDGKISSLKRFKDNVKEVKNGLECGIGLEKFNDIKVGDVFECYKKVERKLKYDEVIKERQKAEAQVAAPSPSQGSALS